MKRLILKGLALTLSAAMLLSMTSCSLFDKASKEVKEAADAFCSDMVAVKPSQVYKACYEFEDEEQYSDMFYNEVSDDREFNEALSAIQATITYEIDDKSFEGSTKSGEGAIDVVFSIVDYESVADEEDEWEDAEAFIDALEDCEDRVEFTITLEFVKDDDEWLVENYDDVFDEYFEYQDADIKFKLAYSSFVSYTEWYMTTDYDCTYHNTTVIDMDFSLNEDGIAADWPELTFEVICDGTVIYTGTACGYISWYECIYRSDDYIPEGNYDIVVYDPDGNIVCQDSCEVYIDTGYAITSTDWWGDADDTSVYDDVTMIELDVWKSNYTEWTGCYFEVYNENLEMIYSSEVDDYDEWVECIYSPSSGMQDGTYTICVYSPEGEQLVSESCEVTNSSGNVVELTYEVDRTDWWCSYDGDNTYSDTEFVELDVWKEYDEDWTGCYFIVYDSNGTSLYEAEVHNYASSIECIYVADGTETIPAGTYNIQVFTPAGTCFVSDYCVVQ